MSKQIPLVCIWCMDEYV